jgi:AcrR family transcriptional regulator
MSFTLLQNSVDSKDRLIEVLEIATRLIARNGFDTASVRMIAGEAGLSQAGLYHYFSSKEDVLYLIQKHTFATLRNTVAARLNPDDSPRDRLSTVIRGHLEFFFAHMDALRVCAFEYNKLNGEHFDEVSLIREDYFRIVHAVVEDVLSENGGAADAPPLNSKRATLYLFGSLNWIHMWFDSERPVSIDTIAAELTGMVLGGLSQHKSLS